jgi:hypothetical protein
MALRAGKPAVVLVRRVVGSAPLQQRAADMAHEMVEEDGTGVATHRLECLVSGITPPSRGRRF